MPTNKDIPASKPENEPTAAGTGAPGPDQTGSAERGLTLTPPDPLMQGLAAIKAEDPDALRIWQVKGPRQGGGTISGVLMQSTGAVVIVHQLPSGKFAIYERRPKPETEAK